jgi:hypothetical protein
MHQANEGVLHKYHPWTMRQAQEDAALQRIENLTWFAIREDVWRYTAADRGWRT